MRRNSRGPARSRSNRSIARIGYYIVTRSNEPEHFHVKTSGIYLRADPEDKAVLDSKDAAERAALIARRLQEWRELANS